MRVGLAGVADFQEFVLDGVVWFASGSVLSRPPPIIQATHTSPLLSLRIFLVASMMQKIFFVERNLLERSLPPHDALRDAAIGDL